MPQQLCDNQPITMSMTTLVSIAITEMMIVMNQDVMVTVMVVALPPMGPLLIESMTMSM